MSAALVVLPQVWAMAEASSSTHPPTQRKAPRCLRPAASGRTEAAKAQPGNLAFYRKYTEAMLRRCLKLSLSRGRATSLVGRELFRANVTHYQVDHFDDAVIFVTDVERCIDRLQPAERHLVRRIGLQEYTQVETAALANLPLRTVIRQYNKALDKLTGMFLERNMLEKSPSETIQAV